MRLKSPVKKRNDLLLRTYGITLKERHNLYLQQDKKCAICKEELNKDGTIKRLCIDHIHIPGYKKLSPEDKKKYVRGLCCFICNVAIKFEKHNKGRQILKGMVEYFNRYKFKGE